MYLLTKLIFLSQCGANSLLVLRCHKEAMLTNFIVVEIIFCMFQVLIVTVDAD